MSWWEPEAYRDEQFCYLTTTGRISGHSHTIEIWFALPGRTLYMLAGGGEGADWVKNLRKSPQALIRLAGVTYPALARFPAVCGDEDLLARRLVGGKYGYWKPGEPFSGWAAEALSVAFDLNVAEAQQVEA